MCEPGKPCPQMGHVQQTYPLLWFFFDGAWSANGGGRAREEDFIGFTAEQMQIAEIELQGICICDEPTTMSRYFGMLADSGYTMWGQTHQTQEVGDDDQHRLLAWALLETRY